MLPDTELTSLIAGGESDCVEFTESSNDMDKFREAICAFANDLPANGKPGVLFIGLQDNGACADLPVDHALLEKLAGLRSDGKIHPFPVMKVDRKHLQGFDVAR